MNTAKVFKTGRSQAVRLPKEFRFRAKEIGIAKVNGAVILFPRNKGWAVLAGALGQFTDDFLSDRNQPVEVEKRRSL